MFDKDLLVVNNLSKHFDAYSVALDNISFTVKEGEFLSVLGPSGCGKTTIMRILIGLLEPTGGQILMDGVDITDYDSSKRNMGIVFQNYALFENMTVLENVEYALKIRKDKKAVAREMAMEMIKRMELTEHANKRPGELSGGQQQRVLLARALCATKKLLLLDEPVSGLDPKAAFEMYGIIESLNKETGITVIMISHDVLSSASSSMTHVLELGKDYFFGTKEEYDRSGRSVFKAFGGDKNE